MLHGGVFITDLKVRTAHIQAERSSSIAAPTVITHQSLVLNLLPDQLVLTKGVTSFSCDGINRAFLHLLLDGTVEHEERFPSTFLHNETGSKTNTEVKVHLLPGSWPAQQVLHRSHSPTDSAFSTCAIQAQSPAAPAEDSQTHKLHCSTGMLSLAWQISLESIWL